MSTFAASYFASAPQLVNQICHPLVAFAIFVPPKSHPLLIACLNQYCELLLPYFAPLVADQVELELPGEALVPAYSALLTIAQVEHSSWAFLPKPLFMPLTVKQFSQSS